MFGYVKVDHSELKVKEYEFYRGTYCGLCRSMGKCTGQCSRMTLNYDFVFLAIVRMAIQPQSVCFKQRRCLVHPIKKRNSMERNQALDYCAAASAILNYQKVADDIADEKGFKRLKAKMALPFVAHSRKKALKRDPQLAILDKTVDKKLAELAEIERGEGNSVDIPAECFGQILGEIMSFGFEGADKRVAYELGRNIGAWIYIADAIEDMEEDLKKGRYNPFLKLYGGRIPTEEELDSILCAVKNHLYGAEAAVDLIDIGDGSVKNIIQNIIYLGITNRTDEIIKQYIQDKSRKETLND